MVKDIMEFLTAQDPEVGQAVEAEYARQQRSAGRTEESHRRVSGVIPDIGPNQVNRHLPTRQNQHLPRGRNRQYFPGNVISLGTVRASFLSSVIRYSM